MTWLPPGYSVEALTDSAGGLALLLTDRDGGNLVRRVNNNALAYPADRFVVATFLDLAAEAWARETEPSETAEAAWTGRIDPMPTARTR